MKGLLIFLIIIALLAAVNYLLDNGLPGSWTGDTSRRDAASKAAAEMDAHKVSNVAPEALELRRVLSSRSIDINTGALNNAQDRIDRICRHAERIRREVQSHRNDPEYLKQLYRTGVGISDEAYRLRCEVRSMQDQLGALSRSNSSLKPLYRQVRSFCSSIYRNENEFNSRNRILRTYVGSNFGAREREWNNRIEARIREKRGA